VKIAFYFFSVVGMLALCLFPIFGALSVWFGIFFYKVTATLFCVFVACTLFRFLLDDEKESEADV
jgi:uncharacterized membrane protein (DUF373 family)